LPIIEGNIYNPKQNITVTLGIISASKFKGVKIRLTITAIKIINLSLLP
jgi:hypothetical protein